MSQWVSPMNANRVIHYLVTATFLNKSPGFLGLQLVTLQGQFPNLGERVPETLPDSGKIREILFA